MMLFFKEGILTSESRAGAHELSVWQCVALSFAVSLAGIVALYAFRQPAFATIDDARLLYVYAGYASGTPEGTYLFSNSIWGGLLASCYSIFPFVNWYFVYHVATIMICSTAFGAIVYYRLVHGGLPLYAGVVIHVAAMLVVFQNAALLLHFEVTAALLGASASAVLLCVSPRQSPRANALIASAAVCFLLFCMLQEKNTFYASAVFFVLAWLFQVASFGRLGKAARRGLAVVMIAGISVVALYAMCGLIDGAAKGDAWDAYMAYNTYRVSFMDYAHPSYEDNVALYQSVGWSEAFYNLTSHVYFMDDRFSSEALSSIVEPFSRVSSSVQGAGVASAAKTFVSLLKAEPITRIQIMCGFALCVFALSLFVSSRKKKFPLVAPFILGISAVLAGVALVFYLAWRGRLPLRAWEAVAFPALFVCAAASIQMVCVSRRVDEGGERVGRRSIPAMVVIAIAWCVIVVSLIVACAQVPRYFYLTGSALEYRYARNAEIASMEQYAIEHLDVLFIYGEDCQNYNPFTLYPDKEKPTNVVIWGTSYAYTPVWYAQLALSGKAGIDSRSFADEDVCFVTSNRKRENRDIDRLSIMLRQDYGIESGDPVMVNDGMHSLYSFRYAATNGNMMRAANGDD